MTTSMTAGQEQSGQEQFDVSVFDRDDLSFDVVRNDEEQYSIWPEGREIPAGWEPAGFRGLRGDCLAHIDRVWTDMRPASVRRWLESAENGG